MNRNFAYSTGKVYDPKSVNKSITFTDIVNIIKGPTPKNYSKIAEYTRQALKEGIEPKLVKKHINPYKKDLPYFLFSGFQSTGHNNKDLEYNGCVQIDIDFKFKGGERYAKNTKYALTQLDFVALAAISPSGVGVKALVYTSNTNIDHHKSVSKQVISYISNYIKIGEKYFDVVGASQPVFVPFDKDVYVNGNASEFEYIEESVSYKVLKNTDTKLSNREIRTALKIAKNSSDEKHSMFGTPWLQSFVGVVNGFGVPYSEVYNFLVHNYKNELSKKRLATIEDMYARYRKEFNTYKVPDSITDKLDFLNSVEVSVNIGNGKIQKLDLPSKAIIVAPTGTGKTTFFSNMEGRKILIVPTQAQVLQIAKDFNASPYFEKAKVISDFIVTTPHSFKNLMSEVNVFEYTIIKDEVHNNTVATTKNFMLDVERFVADVLVNHNNYYCLTATLVRNLHPAYKDLKIIKVDATKNVSKSIKYLNYKGKRNNILRKLCIQNKEQGILNVIYYNNTKVKTMTKELIEGGLNSVIINSKQKDKDNYNDIVVMGEVPKEIDTLVATKVMQEGINIVKHPEHIAIIVVDKSSALAIEQISSRFRNAKSITVYILKNDKYTNKETTFVYDKESKKVLDYVNKLYTSALKMAEVTLDHNIAINNLVDFLNTNNNMDMPLIYLDGVTQEIKIDHLAISNNLYQMDISNMNNDKEYLAAVLNYYNWTQLEDEYMSDVTSESFDEKNILVNSIKSETVREFYEKYDVENDEHKIRNRIRDLYNGYCNTLDEAVEDFKNIGYSTNDWNRFKRREEINLTRLNKIQSDKWVHLFDTKFKIGDELTSSDILVMMKTLTNNENLSKSKAIREFKLYYDVETFYKKRLGITVRMYRINSYSNFNFDVNTISCEMTRLILDEFQPNNFKA